MILGELIRQLERCDCKKKIRFDFCQQVPCGFGSWRGVYAELAIHWCDIGDLDEWPTVAVFLIHARGCVGTVFQGYKGGDYVMDLNTPVHVDNNGDCTDTYIRRIIEDEYGVTLETEYHDD